MSYFPTPLNVALFRLRIPSTLFCVSRLFFSVSMNSKPKSSISNEKISSISSFSKSKSQSAFSATLLSANLKAFICSSVRSSATMQGTSSIPSCLVAINRVCPQTTTLSRSMIIGCLKPNSSMLFATYLTALAFFLGFFS